MFIRFSVKGEKMKSKSIIKMLIAVCVVLLCVLVIASCGDDNKNNNKKTDVDDAEHADDLPADLDFGGESVTIFYWGHDEINNELTADGSSADVVDLAINDRNATIEERLGVTLNPLKGDNDTVSFMATVRDEIMSGSDDYDIILGPQCTSGEVAAAGAFRDLKNVQYIDYSKPYWSDDYMQALSVNDKRFMIGGDVSYTTTAWTSAMIFFIEEYENSFGSSEDLYNLVLEGNGSEGGWTIDALSEKCRDSYVDLNGNGQKDNGDRFGLSFDGTSSTTDRFIFSSGISLTTRDENNKPSLNIKSTQVINFFEKMYNFCWDNVGVNMENGKTTDEEISSIFAAVGMDALVELRGEEKDFGVIPFPKADASMKNYRSWLSDNSIIAAIPITETDDRMDIACATLECFSSENYTQVLPAFYEKSLKNKYTRDSSSAQMLDIIHDGEYTDFACSYSTSLGGIGGMFRQLIGYQEKNIVSWYEARESQTLAKLKQLFEAFDSTYEPSDVITTEDTTKSSGDGSDTTETHENQISNSWKVFGTKYRASQKYVKADMTETFDYVINDSDEIEVRSSEGGGYNPTAVIMSKKQVPLNGLNVEFHADEGFSYTHDSNSYASALSFVWSDSPLTDIPEYLDGIGTNGLRAMIPENAYALVVSFMGTDQTADSISNLLYINLFDGTNPIAEKDNRVGYRWTIWVGTDVYNPTTIEVKEDEELGYVVLVNNAEIREGDRTNETLPIDLSALKEKASGGFIAFGAECSADKGASNFTVSKINGSSAGSYFD